MVTALFNTGEAYKFVTGLWQWDYGQVLRIQGLSLPSAVEIHFSLQETGGEAVTRVGVTKDSVTDVVIPDSMMENEGAVQDYKIYVFVYLSDGASGRTEYKIQMMVRARPKPEGFEMPEGAELFREAIKAVNESAKRAEEAENSAEAWAHGGEEYPERTVDNAAYYAREASTDRMAAEEAAEEGKKAREDAWKALLEAQTAALQAEDYAGQADGYAKEAGQSARNALVSEQAAKTAQRASETARTGAETAEDQARQYAAQTSADSNTVTEAKDLVVEIGQEIADNRASVEQQISVFGTAVEKAVRTINEAGTNQTETVQMAGEDQLAAIRKEAEGIVLANEEIQKNAENISRLSESKTDLETLKRVILEKETGVNQTHVLTDSAEFPVMGMCVYGRTTQETTTGAQLYENASKIDDSALDWEQGIVINENGSVASDFIPVKQGPYISNYYMQVFSYDKNKEFIEYVAHDRLKNFTIENSNVSYIRVAFRTGYNDNIDMTEAKDIMLNAGSTVLPWEPYTGGIPSPNPDYPQELVSAGDKGSIKTSVFGGNLIDLRADESRSNMPDVYIVNGNTVQYENKSGTKQRIITNSVTLNAGTYTVYKKNEVVYEGMRAINFRVNNADHWLDNIDNITLELKEKSEVHMEITSIGYTGIVKYTVFLGVVAGETVPEMDDYYRAPQTLTALTPNNLPGIPVSSGGNYTDENGQQWIADYRDWERGVDVQMVKLADVPNDVTWNMQAQEGGYKLGYSNIFTDGLATQNVGVTWMSNFGNSLSRWVNDFSFGRSGVFWIVPYENEGDITSDDINTWLTEHPMKVLYPLADPIETPIPAEELAAYRALHTNTPVTTIVSDTPLKLSYAVDINRYIMQNYVQKESYATLEERVLALEQKTIS